MTADPTHQIFWLASRAFGIVAIVLLAISVGLGLAMAGRMASRPGWQPRLRRVHEASTLVTLALIIVHGGLLLFDSYLRPGITGVLVPLAMPYRPAFTGVGIIAGWLAAVLGLSFYVRRWIGAKTWRRLHRFTIVAYLLALTHVVGAGTDGRSPWMLAMLSGLTAPIACAFAFRLLGAGHRARPLTDRAASRPAGRALSAAATRVS